ncbi:MAG: DUF938 domain-containing protein [Prochlorotrichaceae cyanobacterium]|jgi:hypothetical protein
MTSADLRQFAPATQRNRSFILAVLQAVLPEQGTVLEISSGTGEHAIFFAPHLQPRSWIPSDLDPIALASIAAWQAYSPAPNLWPPVALDVRQPVWPIEQSPLPAELTSWQDPLRAIVNINMIHISPWECCEALMAGAGRCLEPEGVLYLYGPFKRGGVHTAPSNEAFDQYLRSQNPEWGVRDLEAVETIATDQGFYLTQIEEMPANNFSLIFVKRS